MVDSYALPSTEHQFHLQGSQRSIFYPDTCSWKLVLGLIVQDGGALAFERVYLPEYLLRAPQ
jgi:hypothetical protein